MPEQSVDKSGKQRISLFVGDAAAWKTPPAALAGVVGAKELGELRALASSVQRLNCRYRRCQEAVTLSVALFVVGIGIVTLPGAMLLSSKTERALVAAAERLQRCLARVNQRCAASRAAWNVRQVHQPNGKQTQCVVEVTCRPSCALGGSSGSLAASAGPLPGSGLVGGGMPSSSSSVTASSALGINSDA